jgi:PIN domain nuclease of toxin-antitoxin system
VRLLLDTHVLLWVLEDSPRLSATARTLLADPRNECWVSAVSAWEVAIKVSLGKLSLGRRLSALEPAIEAAGFRRLDISIRHAVAVSDVETDHQDPFDRLLLAQCHVETLKLLTADRRLKTLPQAVPAD